MNMMTAIVLASIVLGLVFAIRSMVRSHLSGGHCASCPGAGGCAHCSCGCEERMRETVEHVDALSEKPSH